MASRTVLGSGISDNPKHSLDAKMIANLIYGVDVIDGLRQLADESVHCVVTSPPYWGLRCYGVDGQIGLEESPGEYLARMVDVFREVRRVLRSDGTCWVNMGDCYANSGGAGWQGKNGARADRRHTQKSLGKRIGEGIKPKDLIGMPWRLAFALQDDGWYLRSDIIWSKPNPMPESVRDRPTKAHEYIFLLTKSRRYFYDIEASKESVTGTAHSRGKGVNPKAAGTGVGFGRVPSGWDTMKGRHDGKVGRYRNPKPKQNTSFSESVKGLVDKRNMRTVWTIATKGYKGAHFATFAPEIPAKCISAGCPEGGTILDPFSGSGTTGEVAIGMGRKYIGIDLNKEYEKLALERIGLFSSGLSGQKAS